MLPSSASSMNLSRPSPISAVFFSEFLGAESAVGAGIGVGVGSGVGSVVGSVTSWAVGSSAGAGC